MTNKTPSGTKKDIVKVLNRKSHQMAKMLFFLVLLWTD